MSVEPLNSDIQTRRILYRLQRVQFPWHSLHTVFVQHYNRLPYLASPLRRTLASQTLVSWPAYGLDSQHLRPLLHDPNAFLLHVATLLPGHYRVYVSLGQIEAVA